jgi:hypothetical protein
MTRTTEITNTEYGATTVDIYTCDAESCDQKTLVDAPTGWLELRRLGDIYTYGDRFADGAHACSTEHAHTILAAELARA